VAQILLFPDPRPLIERLGEQFFRQAPEAPGVYLMRDRADAVLYVGKAKNLRKRLASYRVANPDRLRRRHLRLLRSVERIELHECASESSALARESALLRSLRPRFNRAGTWTGTPRFIAWKFTEENFQLAIIPTIEPGWYGYAAAGTNGGYLCSALARLLWCISRPGAGWSNLPQGWFSGRPRGIYLVPRPASSPNISEEAVSRLSKLFNGEVNEFVEWIRLCTESWTHPFEVAAREADLETISKLSLRYVPTEKT
jgi:predicted GIY-YIG superfamily endonuclease